MTEEEGIPYNIRLRDKTNGTCAKFEVKRFKNVKDLHAKYEYDDTKYDLEFRETERVEL